MTKFQDYYQTLGISRSATPDDVRTAYRSLARSYHPDVNKEPGAEQRFKQISEAYEVLKDPHKRSRYDQLGENWKAGEEFRPPSGWGGARWQTRSGGSGDDADFSDFFDMLFGGQFARDSERGDAPPSPFARAHGPSAQTRQRAQRTRARAGADQHAELTITLADAYHGLQRHVTLEITDQRGRSERRGFDVRIPAGVTEGSVIRLGGQGAAGAGGAPPGDLLLTIRLAPDSRFRIDPHNKHDVLCVLNVSPPEAVLGAKVPLHTLAGDVIVSVPAGAQSGQKLRIRGRGLPKKQGEHGDLLAEIRIVVPQSPHPDEKVLYEKLATLSNFNPRQT